MELSQISPLPATIHFLNQKLTKAFPVQFPKHEKAFKPKICIFTYSYILSSLFVPASCLCRSWSQCECLAGADCLSGQSELKGLKHHFSYSILANGVGIALAAVPAVLCLSCSQLRVEFACK